MKSDGAVDRQVARGRDGAASGSADSPDLGRVLSAASRNGVFERLGSAPGGLSSGEAARRLSERGANVLAEVHGRSLGLRFMENFYHLFAIMLGGCARDLC